MGAHSSPGSPGSGIQHAFSHILLTDVCGKNSGRFLRKHSLPEQFTCANSVRPLKLCDGLIDSNWGICILSAQCGTGEIQPNDAPVQIPHTFQS